MSFLGSFGNFALSGLQPTGDIQIESPLAPARPTLPQGPINLGGIQGNVSGNVPSSSVSNPSSVLPNLPPLPGWDNTALPGQSSASEATGAGGAVGTGTSNPTSWLLSSRVVSGVLGLICIGGGLFMFNQTRELIVNTGKTAAKLVA